MKRLGQCSMAAALLAVHAGAAMSQTHEGDPYAHDLRLGVFPVHFQAGVSQSQVGSAARIELDLMRGLGMQLAGRLGWLRVAGEDGPVAHSLRAGVIWHVLDVVEDETLSGTVHPEDSPAAGAQGPGTDTDLDVPVHNKLGGPRLDVGERDRTLTAAMRNVHSVRAGYEYNRGLQLGRPRAEADDNYHVLNDFHAFYAGYGWGSHWNLTPAQAGQREVGHRRFYVDATLTLRTLHEADVRVPLDFEPEFFPVGVRIGMEGTLAGFVKSPSGLGFAYTLELGALPGTSGLEGYLFVGLGVSLDLPLGIITPGGSVGS